MFYITIDLNWRKKGTENYVGCVGVYVGDFWEGVCVCVGVCVLYVTYFEENRS